MSLYATHRGNIMMNISKVNEAKGGEGTVMAQLGQDLVSVLINCYKDC